MRAIAIKLFQMDEDTALYLAGRPILKCSIYGYDENYPNATFYKNHPLA